MSLCCFDFGWGDVKMVLGWREGDHRAREWAERESEASEREIKYQFILLQTTLQFPRCHFFLTLFLDMLGPHPRLQTTTS